MSKMKNHAIAIGLLLASSCAMAAQTEHLPRPDRVVVVIEENRGYSQILNMEHAASTINMLAQRGMVFTQSYGVTHPSQPNFWPCSQARLRT
jgi:hypothetical protein